MFYSYTAQTWPSLLTAPLLVVLGAYSWRRRSVPGALPFMIACLFSAAWSAGTVMEYVVPDVAARIAWHKFGIACQVPIVIATTCFFLEYTWPGRWLTRGRVLLLSLPYLPALILLYSRMLQPLFIRFGYDGKVVQRFGPYGWFILVYSFLGLSCLNLIVCAWLFRRSPQHRWPAALMVAGQIAGRTAYLLDVIGVLYTALPVNFLGLSIEFLVYAAALFGFHLLDPVALARQAVTVQMWEGMLVLDLQGRITWLNPAAGRIFGAASGRLLGRRVRELLPACPEAPLAGGQATEVELSLGTGPALRQYTLQLSSLSDWRGLAVGGLVILRDVTERMQAQAQILEQQRALAMLREREQLARELHDSTGEVLGYAGFQLEVVHDRILDGLAAVSAGHTAAANAQLTEAGEQLRRLSSVVEQAHADLREKILNLRLSPTGQQPLFAALRHYLESFSQNYAIQTELSVVPAVDESRLNPEAQMELFRIIQESLSNARKHGGATCVQIGVDAQDGLLRIQVQDNGRGFDSDLAAAGKDIHFGLRFMRERVEKLRGRLQIESAPGAGTRVTVEVPIGDQHA